MNNAFSLYDFTVVCPMSQSGNDFDLNIEKWCVYLKKYDSKAFNFLAFVE